MICDYCNTENTVIDWFKGKKLEELKAGEKVMCESCFRNRVKQQEFMIEHLGKMAQKTGDFSKLDSYYLRSMSEFEKGGEALAEIQQANGMKAPEGVEMPNIRQFVRVFVGGQWERRMVSHCSLASFKVSGSKIDYTLHAYGQTWRY